MLTGYARVSTDDQNLALERNALKVAGCERVFEDHGISGATRVRPGLDSALAALSAGDMLVVWKLDRLGRSLSHLVETLATSRNTCSQPAACKAAGCAATLCPSVETRA